MSSSTNEKAIEVFIYDTTTLILPEQPCTKFSSNAIANQVSHHNLSLSTFVQNFPVVFSLSQIFVFLCFLVHLCLW